MEKSDLYRKATVVKNISICADHYCVTLRDDMIAKRTIPGQFVNLRVPGREDLLLRRPFSVAITYPGRSQFDIVYRVVGQGTRAMVDLRKGDVVDLLGPLGTGFHPPEDRMTCLLVGGGCGVAPLWGLAEELSRKKNKLIALIGFQSSDKVFGETLFQKFGAETVVATDDGSYGLKGFVSEHLEVLLARQIGRVYVCGPTPMLRAIFPMILKASIKGEVSLEERMACGYGVCLSCVTTLLKNGMVDRSRICTEGPVFNIEEVLLSDES